MFKSSSDDDDVEQAHIFSNCCDSYKWVDSLFHYHQHAKDFNESIYIHASASNQPNSEITTKDNRFSSWLCREEKQLEEVCYQHAMHPEATWNNPEMMIKQKQIFL